MNIIDSVFFHEDNYCQIELLPIQNLFSENSAMQNYSNENFNGDGFITATARDETKFPLYKLEISYSSFVLIVEKIALFSIEKVYTGYLSHRVLKNNISAYGFENYILYIESNNGLISKLWIDYYLFSDTLNGYPHTLQTTLYELGLKYELVLVDWNEFLTVILKNNNQLNEYISQVLD